MAITDTTNGGFGWVKASGSNNSGTILGAGNINTSTGPVKNDLGVDTNADNIGETVNSKIVTQNGTVGDKAGIGKAVSAGTLAFNPSPGGTRSETFVIQGFTIKLSDVANNSILGGARYKDEDAEAPGVYRNLHPTTYDRKHGTKSSSFEDESEIFNILARPSTEITPNFTKSDDAGDSFTYFDSPGVAKASFPSRSVPGEVTHYIGRTITTNYEAR